MHRQTTRSHIIEASDQLFYQQGFEHTSFANIAQAVQISRGNFYYHFKTKDEILHAVIDKRLSDTQKMLELWEQDGDDPIERIRCFIHILIDNRRNIKRYGCPVGSLSIELTKLDHVSRKAAKQLFSLFRKWLRKQFSLLGRKSDADELAMHLLARSQGVAILASAYQDEKFINREVKTMYDWLDSVAEQRGI